MTIIKNPEDYVLKIYDYIIVGAGLAGSTIARLLCDEGYKVKIVDKRDVVGGNCYTYKQDNIMIHKYGPHIFHTSNPEVWEFVNRFAEFNNFINQPIAVTENNELYNMPFNMNTFSKMFNTRWPEEVKDIINLEIKEYCKSHPDINNLEDQAINMVGTTIYNKLIKGYTEKQWNAKCTDLDPSIIKRLPLRFTYNNNYFDDKYQGIPVEGYTAMIENMIEDIDIELNCDFKENKDRLLSEARNLIYTGSIDEFFDYKYGKLGYRSLKFSLQRMNTSNYQGNAVVNYTGTYPDYTRTVEHKHFNDDKSDITYVTFEYPETSGDPMYPLLDEDNIKLYQKYLDLQKSSIKPANATIGNIYFAGRLGKYKYFDMDDVIEDCIKLVDSIIFKRQMC